MPILDGAALDPGGRFEAEAWAAAQATQAGGAPIPLTPLSNGQERVEPRAGGQGLAPEVRGRFERRLGHDLSQVRIHADGAAAADAARHGAAAYTLGQDVVFGDGLYRPGTPGGDRLLAHELAHTVQQRGGVALQRAVHKEQGAPITRYEYRGGEQVATSTPNGGHVDLAYDDVAGTLTCTFLLYWQFPPSMDTAARTAYKTLFSRRVRERWESASSGLSLRELDASGGRTGRVANVVLSFKESTVPPLGDSVDEIMAAARADDPASNAARAERMRRLTVNVRPVPDRDNVTAGSEINLDRDSNSSSRHPYRAPRRPGDGHTFTNDDLDAPDFDQEYGHYTVAGIRITPPEAGSVPTQVPVQHEFGHVLGLADEYILSQQDYNDLVAGVGRTEANARLRERTQMTPRIMNVGGRVTLDAYRPFAGFIGRLTPGTTWEPYRR